MSFLITTATSEILSGESTNHPIHGIRITSIRCMFLQLPCHGSVLGIHAGLLPGQTDADTGRIRHCGNGSDNVRNSPWLTFPSPEQHRPRTPGTRSDPVVEETFQCETHCQNIRILSPSSPQPGTIVGYLFSYMETCDIFLYFTAKNPGRSQSPWPHFLFHGRQ